MRVADVLELENPKERVRRMRNRLIPLCQGDDLMTRPPAVQTFFSLSILGSEASNGSLHQYFSNRAGDTWHLAKDAIEALGSDEVRGIFREALALFPGGEPSRDRGKRSHQLADVDTQALAALGKKLLTHEHALFEAMSRHLIAKKEDFGFLDRFPNGFKAIPIPSPVHLADISPEDPFLLITATYAALHDKGGARGPIEQRFLDVFSFADEVSVAGFESYFFTRAADRHIEVLSALRGLGLDEIVRLLDQAIAVVPGTLAEDAAPRRVQLTSLTDDGREVLAGLSQSFQSQRLALATALAKYVSAHLSVFATAR